MAARLMLVIALGAGCRYTGAFECDTDDQCRHGMTPGRCESVGYCSFPDGMCSTGFRYDDNSPPSYAGACVGTPPIDASTIDAPFTVAMCPLDYTIQIPSTAATSRYRLIDVSATAWPLVADCDDDALGKTHAVIPQMQLELAELSAWISAAPHLQTQFIAGAVQSPVATSIGGGWVLLDGMVLPTALWNANEPDDSGDGTESDHDEQLVQFDIDPAARRLEDVAGGGGRGIVCECDGKPWSTVARLAFDNDPNNPN